MTVFEWLLLRSARWLLPALALAWALALLGALATGTPPEARWGVYALLSVLAYLGLRHWADAVREQFIRVSPLPHALGRALRRIYPHLSARDTQLAERALRQFFIACLRSRGQYTAVPSRAVDVLWEAFTRHTPAYGAWCRTALGHVPAHSPAQTLGKKAHYNDGLRRAWYWACCDESINPRQPSRLPLLFALDAKLGLPDGVSYATHPAAAPTQHAPQAWHYGSSFADGGYSGHAADFGGMERHHPWGSSADGSSHDAGADGDGSDGGDGGGGDGGGD